MGLTIKFEVQLKRIANVPSALQQTVPLRMSHAIGSEDTAQTDAFHAEISTSKKRSSSRACNVDLSVSFESDVQIVVQKKNYAPVACVLVLNDKASGKWRRTAAATIDLVQHIDSSNGDWTETLGVPLEFTEKARERLGITTSKKRALRVELVIRCTELGMFKDEATGDKDDAARTDADALLEAQERITMLEKQLSEATNRLGPFQMVVESPSNDTQDRVQELEYDLDRANKKDEENNAKIEKLSAELADAQMKCREVAAKLVDKSANRASIEKDLKEALDKQAKIHAKELHDAQQSAKSVNTLQERVSELEEELVAVEQDQQKERAKHKRLLDETLSDFEKTHEQDRVEHKALLDRVRDEHKNEVEELRKQLDEPDSSVVALEEQCRVLREQCSSIEKECDALKQEKVAASEAHESEITLLKNTHQQLVDSIEEERVSLRAENKALCDAAQQKAEKAKETDQYVADASSSVYHRGRTHVEPNVFALQAQLDAAREKIETLNTNEQTAIEGLRVMEERCSSIQSMNSELESSLAQRTTEQDELRVELSDLDTRVKELMSSVDEKQNRIAQLESELKSACERVKVLEEEKKAIDAELGDKADVLNASAGAITALKESVNDKEAKNTLLQVEMKAKDAEISKKRDELKANEESLNALQEDVEQKNVLLSEAEAKIKLLQDEFKAKDVELEKKVDEVNAKVSVINALEESVVEKVAKITQLEADVESTTAQIEAHKNEVNEHSGKVTLLQSDFEMQNSKMREKIVCLDKEIQEQKEALKELNAANDAKSEQITDLQAQSTDLDRKNAELTESVDSLQHSLDTTEATITQLNTEKCTLNERLEQLQAEINEKQLQHSDELDAKSCALYTQSTELRAKDAELADLRQTMEHLEEQHTQQQDSITTLQAKLDTQQEAHNAHMSDLEKQLTQQQGTITTLQSKQHAQEQEHSAQMHKLMLEHAQAAEEVDESVLCELRELRENAIVEEFVHTKVYGCSLEDITACAQDFVQQFQQWKQNSSQQQQQQPPQDTHIGLQRALQRVCSNLTALTRMCQRDRRILCFWLSVLCHVIQEMGQGQNSPFCDVLSHVYALLVCGAQRRLQNMILPAFVQNELPSAPKQRVVLTRDVMAVLDELWRLCDSMKVATAIRGQLVGALFGQINAVLVHNILFINGYCTSANGYKIKLEFSLIHEWIASHGDMLPEDVHERLRPIMQIANFLMSDKAQLNSVTRVTELLSDFSEHDALQLCTMYIAEGKSKTVPKKTVKALTKQCSTLPKSKTTHSAETSVKHMDEVVPLDLNFLGPKVPSKTKQKHKLSDAPPPVKPKKKATTPTTTPTSATTTTTPKKLPKPPTTHTQDLEHVDKTPKATTILKVEAVGVSSDEESSSYTSSSSDDDAELL